MDADWYEDPLGRYDGRFFDGEAWTKQVSADGTLATDPDFPPSAITSGAASVDPVVASPAVEALPVPVATRASTADESPARVVAVLDERVMQDEKPPRRGRDWRWLAVVAAAVAVAVLAGLVWGRSTETATPVALDAAEEDRVEDLLGEADVDLAEPTVGELEVATAAPVDPPANQVDPTDAVEVGRLQVANGRQILEQVQVWHRSETELRGIDLNADAGCWFGSEGDAAVQSAYCGPVGNDDDRILFDQIPLLLRQIDGELFALAAVDDYEVDIELPSSLELIGHRDGTPPPATMPARRGDRVGVN